MRFFSPDFSKCVTTTPLALNFMLWVSKGIRRRTDERTELRNRRSKWVIFNEISSHHEGITLFSDGSKIGWENFDLSSCSPPTVCKKHNFALT